MLLLSPKNHRLVIVFDFFLLKTKFIGIKEALPFLSK